MRKFFTLFLGTAAVATLALTPPERPGDFDPLNLNHMVKIEKYQEQADPAGALFASMRPKRQLAKAYSEGEAIEMYVAAQKFHKGYTFNYDGGDVVSYPIEVTVEGDKVTISNLFNLAAQSTEWSVGVDYDVVGTYDADAKTITISTPNDLDNGTLAGTIGSYNEVLLAGEVNTSGQMAPVDELVFNVIGDFEGIEATQSFGIQNYWADYGWTMGFQTIYRAFIASAPNDTPRLVAFNDRFDMGETFPGQDAEVSFTVVNISTSSVDYVIDVDSDGDSYSVTPDAGTFEPQTSQEFTVKFNPSETGEFEGVVSFDYEGDEEVTIFFNGTAIAPPDFSGAVKSGDFTFSTNIDFPFEMTQLEDGTNVARSTVNGAYGTSKLTVEFEVPEGKIGTFSWKGASVNTGYWYQNAGGYFIDDAPNAAASWTDPETDITGSLEFAPGKHSVRFQYEGLNYTGDPKNGLYVYDLELACEDAPASKVELVTPAVNLGNFMIKDESGIQAFGNITLQNRGLEPLKVTNVTSSNEELTASVPDTEAGLLETITIPLTLSTTTAGEFNATVAIATNAGNVTANVSALVRQMADFTPVVTEGIEVVTGFSTSEQYPFEVENGVAFNANSGEADDMPTESWFQINFTIPEGKAGFVTWDGTLYGDCPDPENAYWAGDGAYFEYSHPMNSGTKNTYPNESDASSATFANDPLWADKLICIPGTHYFKFKYNKNGDGRISEKDRLEISNFRIRVEDFLEHAVEPSTTEVVFEEPIYVGENRYSTATVTFKNTGSEPLEILDVDADHPFYGVLPTSTYPTQFGGTVDVGIWFYPSEEGEFEGDLTFQTNAGDVKIHCKGSTKSAEGILLIGDVENQGYGWSFYDADQDGTCWNLGYNLWGLNPAWVHGGNDCFGSPSWDPYVGAIIPDNWLFSPVVNIPDNGATLEWYAASHHHERYAEHYSVYVEEPETVKDAENLAGLTPLFSETLDENSADEWVEHTLDLSNFSGKDVVICFRHHDCNGQYVLKIDDIFVYEISNEDSAVESSLEEGNVVSTEIFDTNGLRTRGLVNGVNIIRKTYGDGSVKVEKIIVRK